MNSKILTCATIAIALSSAAAIAAGPSPTDEPTRAQVRAEVVQARASGQLTPAGQGPIDFAAPASGLDRGAVKSQTRAARESGQLRPAGEAGDLAPSAGYAPSSLTRAQVRAETLAAARAGELAPAGELYDGPSAEPAARKAHATHATLAR